MKLPISYREQFFTPLLTISILGHAVLIGGQAFWGNQASYGVRLAPSSMEVVMVRQKPLPVKESAPKVMTSQQSNREVLEPEKIPQKQQEDAKSLVTPEDQGAQYLEEAELYLRNSPPVYPELARREGWQGLVILQVQISPKGDVSAIHVEKTAGYKILDQAALRAVQKWKFSPRRVGPVMVASNIRIPVRFTLIDKN